MGCYEIVKEHFEQIGEGDHIWVPEHIEVHHPPEAIEEVEVPVWEAKHDKTIPHGTPARWLEETHKYYIKLYHCTQCHQVFLEKP